MLVGDLVPVSLGRPSPAPLEVALDELANSLQSVLLTAIVVRPALEQAGRSSEASQLLAGATRAADAVAHLRTLLRAASCPAR